MPCSCKKTQPPAYPETDSWGPVVWAILHGLAERTGRLVSPIYRKDERNQWINLLQELPKVIPCSDCREHAVAWISAHPIAPIRTLPDGDLRDWLITWVYDFHESVNVRSGKPTFDRSLLNHTYGSVSIRGALVRLKPFIEVAIRLSGLTLLPWQKWGRHVTMLISIYGG